MKKFVGIDVSQKDFHVAIPLDTEHQDFTNKTFSNDKLGVDSFIHELKISTGMVHCVLEATGNYSLLLTYQLVEAGISVSVLNPKSSAHFRAMLLQTTKTDAIDSQLLALYGFRMQPSEFEPPSEEIMKLKQQRSVLNQLQKMLQAQKNLLHALKTHPFQDDFSIQQVEHMITTLEKQITQVKKRMSELVKIDFEECYQYVISVKSIGERIATAMIEVTGGFTVFDNAKSFSKFIGISPTYYESGTSVKVRGQINRSGDPTLRSLLYMASWSAIRYNAPCKELYERLKAAGKPSKVALVAVMNKLLRQVFGVVKNKQLFDNEWESRQKEEKIAAKTPATPQ